MSKPLQVYLDEAELERLEAFSSARGWTKSQTIRAAIRALTRERGEDPILELSGDIEGLPADFSENFHQHLNETFVAEPSGTYRARRRSRSTVRR